MATNDELNELVQGFAADIAAALPDPEKWGDWLCVLLDDLEQQMTEKGLPPERFKLALVSVRKAITQRLENSLYNR